MSGIQTPLGREAMTSEVVLIDSCGSCGLRGPVVCPFGKDKMREKEVFRFGEGRGGLFVRGSASLVVDLGGGWKATLGGTC